MYTVQKKKIMITRICINCGKKITDENKKIFYSEECQKMLFHKEKRATEQEQDKKERILHSNQLCSLWKGSWF